MLILSGNSALLQAYFYNISIKNNELFKNRKPIYLRNKEKMPYFAL